ncbi:alpha/beta hydrolase [Spongisporangium articulatum]|uniref:Alpha/beta hydrolase n=1 Tax=Spongisporangium articulatum TaxID=3362603 RepID=A0ABW8AM50_9ACTN
MSALGKVAAVKLSLPEWLVATFLRLCLKPVLGPPFPIAFQRFWMEFCALLNPPPLGNTVRRVTLGGVPDVLVTPAGVEPDGEVSGPPPGSTKGPTGPRPVVLYLHGGAFITGSYRSHAGLVGYLARGLRAPVHAIEYRLGPEHTWPAGHDDALAAYRALLARVPAHRLVVAGDSAGGVMVADLLLALRDSGEPQPAAAVMLSPAVGLDAERRPGAGERDTVVRRGWIAQVTAAMQRPTDDPHEVLLGRDLTGLAPIHLQYSTEELFADECAEFAAQLRAAAQSVGSPDRNEVRVFAGPFHVLAVLPGVLKRSRAALAEVVQFAAGRVHAATAAADAAQESAQAGGTAQAG